MDGVIVDSNPFHKTALLKFVEKHGFNLSEKDLRDKIFGRANKDWIPNLFGDVDKDKLEFYAEEKESLFRSIYDKAIEPLRGIVGFLDLLERNKIPKAIGTSAPPANVRFTLEKTNLTNYFDIILDETFVTRGKPDPEIYLKTAAALGLKPSDCIVFEDSLAGVKAAKDAGCKVVGILSTHSSEELAETEFNVADFTLITLEQLDVIFVNNEV